MKDSRAQGRVSKSLPALLLALAAACATHSGPPPGSTAGPATAAGAVTEPELRVGEPIERELAPGEVHRYRVEVPAGSYLRIVAEPKAVDVALTLLAPDGTTLAVADGPGGSKERELLSLVAATGGSCRLALERKDEGKSRGYSLVLQELRSALTTDEKRVRAESLFSEALHLQSLDTSETREQAIPMFEESRALWQELGDSVGQVECLNQAGLALYSQGQTKEAMAHYASAELLARTAGYQRGQGEALNNLGLAYSRLSEPQEALDHYQRALAIWRKTGIVVEAAITLHNIGVFYEARGEPRLAVKSLEEALPLWRSVSDLAGEANSLNSLGLLHLWYLGETSLAMEYLHRAQGLSKASGSLSTDTYVTSNLALAHRLRGELQQALQLYGRAVELGKQLGDPTSLGNIREAMAGLHAELGDFERAAEEYRAVLELYRKAENRDLEARVLTSLGGIKSLLGQPAAALDEYRQALSISRATGNRRIEAIALHRSGIAHLALDDLRDASADLQRCLALSHETGNRADEASALLHLGLVQHRLGVEGSLQNFERALELARRSENAALQASILLRWAGVDRDADRLDSALARVEEAIGIIESVRQQVASRDFRATYFAARREYYETYIDLLMKLDSARPEGAFAEKAFEASERARARSLLELLAEGRIDVRSGIAVELRERERQLKAKITSTQSRLIDLSSRGGDATQIGIVREELGGAVQELKDLESEIRVRHPRYAEVRYPPTLTLRQVQPALAADVALIEYALGKRGSYLFVVTKERFRVHRLPPAQEIGDEVERFRRALASPERRLLGQLLSSARRLYDLLIAPAADALGEAPKLIVVADGALHLVPFEALVSTAAAGERGHGPPFLLLTHSMSYVPSASVLPGLHNTRASGHAGVNVPRSLVVFADPELSAAPASATRVPLLGLATNLAALPESRREAQAIAELYPASEVGLFLGADATEENAKREGVLSETRRIHFATHAFLSEGRPELSGLVLGNTEASSEDGLLQVYEIFNLQLQADLVVLSACESGLGQAVAGEGLVGLTRAFLYAGTSSLVVSLWPVNDSSTAGLMIEFYRRLDQGRDRGEALRMAKLSTLANAEVAHPFYWAPFILLGET